MADLEKLEARLRRDIEAAQAAGYKIVRRLFVVEATKKCCAIGACRVVDPINRFGKDDRPSNVYAAQEFGLSCPEVNAFISGFDGAPISVNPWMDRKGLVPYYELGIKLAKEYVDA